MSTKYTQAQKEALELVKGLTKDFTDQQKIDLAEAWNWTSDTDGSVQEQIVFYTNINQK